MLGRPKDFTIAGFFVRRRAQGEDDFFELTPTPIRGTVRQTDATSNCEVQFRFGFICLMAVDAIGLDELDRSRLGHRGRDFERRNIIRIGQSFVAKRLSQKTATR